MSWLFELRQREPGRFEEDDVGRVYAVSLYWAMATALTIGYGELTPRTSVEQLFAVWMMLFSSLLYACIFGQVTTLVDSLDQINRRYQSALQRYTEVASIYRLPWSLRGRIYAHVHFNWQVRRGVDIETALESLPGSLRRDCQMFVLSNIVANFPIFANTPVNFVTAVVEKFRNELLVANEFVFVADEPGKHLYIIHIGRVEVITSEGVLVGKLADGGYFGEVAILCDVRRTSSVRTVCRCHFYKLSKEDFDDVLEGFPELRERIVAKAMQRLQKTMKVRSKTAAAAAPASAQQKKNEATDSARHLSAPACIAARAAGPCADRRSSSAELSAMAQARGAQPAKRTSLAGPIDDVDAAALRVLANGVAQTSQQWEQHITVVSEATMFSESFEDVCTRSDAADAPRLQVESESTSCGPVSPLENVGAARADPQPAADIQTLLARLDRIDVKLGGLSRQFRPRSLLEVRSDEE